MTGLFPIPLRGIGTPLVESLSSFVLRLAFAHGVSTRQLLTAISAVRAPGLLNGYSDFAATTAEKVSALVSQSDVAHGTLLRFRYVLSTNANESIVPTRRWCSSCIADDLDKGDSGYDPLIWSIRSVSMCPKHDCWLVSACPHCMSPQQYLPYGGATRTHCNRCGCSLGARTGHATPSPSELWCRAELSDLLTRGGDKPFDSDAPHAFLTAFVRLVGKGVAPIAREVGIDAHTIRGLLGNPIKKPTLATVLRLSASVQQPVELLLGAPLAAAAQGQFSFDAPRHERIVRTRLSSALRQQLGDALRKAAYDEGQALPRSVASICREHRVTQGCAHYAFPVLVSRVSARRMGYLAAHAANVEGEALLIVKRHLATLAPADIEAFSQKKLVKQLMETSRLPKRSLARAVRASIDLAMQQCDGESSDACRGMGPL